MGSLNLSICCFTKISKALKNKNIHNQERIDEVLINLDGSRQKTKLGANAILAVSMAAKKLSAKVKKIQLLISINSNIFGKYYTISFYENWNNQRA